jgi:ergothioneine biosynthesis protein EgtB
MKSIIEKYQSIRSATEKICAPLQVEDYSAQPAVFVSPPKWHLAHSTWFFETFVLQQFKTDYTIFNADFSFLFNSYYNGIGDRIQRHERGTITRPTVAEVYTYRKYIDNQISDLLEKNSSLEILKLIELGLNHEQQHQELLLTDIKYILGMNPTFPVYDKNFKEYSDLHQTEIKPVQIQSGNRLIGLHKSDEFYFDNESPQHTVYLQDCVIDNRLVTNGEYLEFMTSGGYNNYDFWLDAGWSWIKTEKITAPLYWHFINGDWYSYQLSGLKKIDLNAPVTHISFYEASAFADWKGMRLPTEFEWESVADKLNYGQRWEWTNSAYLPYHGFKKAKGAVGEYNGKFMINQMILRGASIATPTGHSRPTYRNFFHPEERWQFTGIRLAQ